MTSIRVSVLGFVPLLLAFSACSSHAEPVFYSFTQALASRQAKAVLDPPFPLFFGSQGTPALAEKGSLDTYTRSAFTPFLFGSPEKLCMEAFADGLKNMISDARRGEYDVIVGISGWGYGSKSFREDGFECDAGIKTSEVRMQFAFAMTQAGAQRADEIERDPTRWVMPKKSGAPSKNVISFPFESVLTSPAAKAILGPLKVHWGLHGAPAYRERSIPNDYSEEASVKELGRDGACRQAALNVLSAIVADMKEKSYDGIIKLRSYLDEQPALNDTDFECEAGSKWANVQLLATLIKAK